MQRTITTIIFFIIFLTAIIVIASSGGKTGRTNLSDTPGCTCHGSNPSSGVQVFIEGADTVKTNSTTTYKVKISGGPAAAAGTNIAVSQGSLAPVSGTLQLLSGELTHTAPLSFGGNTEVVFEFEYTAPASIGQITLAANGNSVNLNGGTSGDQWNFAENKVVRVEAPNAITDRLDRSPSAFTLKQNFPNPFNPDTKIRYALSAANFVKLTVFNSLGQKVRTLVRARQNSGIHQVDFKAADLPSGSYFYTLRVGSETETRRMILKK